MGFHTSFHPNLIQCRGAENIFNSDISQNPYEKKPQNFMICHQTCINSALSQLQKFFLIYQIFSTYAQEYTAHYFQIDFVGVIIQIFLFIVKKKKNCLGKLCISMFLSKSIVCFVTLRKFPLILDHRIGHIPPSP